MGLVQGVSSNEPQEVESREMDADYDKIARQFKKSRELPFRTAVEEHTVLAMLGNVEGLSVLDLACGEGHYARMLRRRGAAKVVGADLSAGMIALARQTEASEPLGIEYVQAGVEALGIVGAFDVITAVYLLHYATSREQLEAMCKAVAANLRPEGRFIAMVCTFTPGAAVDLSQYGWNLATPIPNHEGEPFRLRFLPSPDTFEIENYLYTQRTYEDALQKAGFSSVSWRTPEVSEVEAQALGREYWRSFLEVQPILGIECRKESTQV